MTILPIVLVLRLALLPDLPPIQVDRYETVKECQAVAKEIDESTRLILVYHCQIDT